MYTPSYLVKFTSPLLRSTPGGSAICSAAELAYYGAKGEGKSNHLAGAIAGKVFYNKVGSYFDFFDARPGLQNNME